ncbi:MAG: SDR family oxidoreductase [Armatimonadota bacterium]
MSRIALVTGGAGFIGSRLVHRLLQGGWQVRVLDNFSSGSRSNLAGRASDLEILEGDVREEAACRRATEGVDTLFHLAALVSVPLSVDDPSYAHSVNVNGTLNLLNAARERGVRRFVFSSSASVYGNAERVPTDESQPLKPESPYASGKACGELYCRNFWQLYGLETVCLRYFNVFGTGQNVQSGYAAVVPMFVDAALRGASPTVYGDGRQTRDFVHVENVVDANVLAADSTYAPGGVYNVAGGNAVSLLDLLDVIGELLGCIIEPVHLPERPGDVRDSRAEITRARRDLGYAPRVSLREGLRAMLTAQLDPDGTQALAGAAVGW